MISDFLITHMLEVDRGMLVDEIFVEIFCSNWCGSWLSEYHAPKMNSFVKGSLDCPDRQISNRESIFSRAGI